MPNIGGAVITIEARRRRWAWVLMRVSLKTLAFAASKLFKTRVVPGKLCGGTKLQDVPIGLSISLDTESAE
jgi:hypothetical protein